MGAGRGSALLPCSPLRPRRVGALSAGVEPLGAGFHLASSRHAAVAGRSEIRAGIVELLAGIDRGGMRSFWRWDMALLVDDALPRSDWRLCLLDPDDPSVCWLGSLAGRPASARCSSARAGCAKPLAHRTVGVVGRLASGTRVSDNWRIRADFSQRAPWLVGVLHFVLDALG